MYKFVSVPLDTNTQERKVGEPHIKYKVSGKTYLSAISEDEHRWLRNMLLGKIITKEVLSGKVKFILDGEFVKMSFITRFMDDMIVEGDTIRIKKPTKFSIVYI